MAHRRKSSRSGESAFDAARKRMLTKQKRITQHQRKKSQIFEDSKQRFLAKQEAINKIKAQDNKNSKHKQPPTALSSSPYMYDSNETVQTPEKEPVYTEYHGEIALPSSRSVPFKKFDNQNFDPNSIFE